jgi:hypothetical protein
VFYGYPNLELAERNYHPIILNIAVRGDQTNDQREHSKSGVEALGEVQSSGHDRNAEGKKMAVTLRFDVMLLFCAFAFVGAVVVGAF